MRIRVETNRITIVPVQLSLHDLCSQTGDDEGPGVTVRIWGLQLFGDVVHMDAESEGSAHNVSTSNGEICNIKGHGSSSG